MPFLQKLLNLIYPPICLLCREYIPATDPLGRKEQICHACQNSIPENRPPFCGKCSRALKDSSTAYCRACQKTPFAFDRAWGIFPYTPSMRRLIHLFKYGRKTALRHYFARRMLGFLQTYRVDLSTTDYLVPVPLHATRFRERGFNQADMLTSLIGEKCAIPISNSDLVRTRHTHILF